MCEIWFPGQAEWPVLHIYVILGDVIINRDPRIDQTPSFVRLKYLAVYLLWIKWNHLQLWQFAGVNLYKPGVLFCGT